MPQSKQPLEPLPGYVVLKEYKLDQRIAGRLYMPTDAQNAPSLGEVLSVGDVINKMPFERDHLPSKGDIVAYQNYGGQELQLEGQKYFLVPFDKLLAKLNIKESK